MPMAIYWLNLLLLGVLLHISLTYASHAGLMSPDSTAHILHGSERRIVVYQFLNARACLLCVVNT
jgi:TMEM175 potassium channel family protein